MHRPGNAWTNEQMDRQTDRQMDRRTHRQRNRWMDGQTNRWTIEKLGKFSTRVQACHLIHTSCRSELTITAWLFRQIRKGSVDCVPCFQGRYRPGNAWMKGQMDRQTDGQMDRQMDQQTDRQRDRWMDGQTD